MDGGRASGVDAELRDDLGRGALVAGAVRRESSPRRQHRVLVWVSALRWGLSPHIACLSRFHVLTVSSFKKEVWVLLSATRKTCAMCPVSVEYVYALSAMLFRFRFLLLKFKNLSRKEVSRCGV